MARKLVSRITTTLGAAFITAALPVGAMSRATTVTAETPVCEFVSRGSPFSGGGSVAGSPVRLTKRSERMAKLRALKGRFKGKFSSVRQFVADRQADTEA